MKTYKQNETPEFEMIRAAAPEEEGARQYYFIEEAKILWKQQFESMVDSGEATERYEGSLLSELQAEGKYGTFHISTFGCQMNARDSEKLCGILEQIGLKEVESENADLVLYNTCTVRDNANQKVYGRLGYLQTLKKKRPGMMISLCGCMMQEPSVIEKIQKSYSYVDLIFGTHNIFKLAELLCCRMMSGNHMVVDIWKDTDKIVEELPVDRKYSFKSGVNIMFGCNNFCSYCIVPYVRGRERSRKPEDIVAEIKKLVADGVAEVMLLGQNVNSYGKNLEHPMTFAELLREINKIEGLERIRFMTSHPKDLSDDLIEAMRNRHYDKEGYLALVDKLRAAIPDIALTTDIIVGFPGETEEDFEETMDVVRRVRYDSAFTFIYSKRTGTPAAAMEQVPEEVVKERFDRLLKEVQKISSEVCGRDLHTTQKVLVETLDDHKEGYVTGRLSNNTVVHFPGDESLIGKIVDVWLEESKGFYYMGKQVEGQEN